MSGEVARQDAWEESYGRRENFVFQPSDEFVRFVSRHIRRRVGLDEFVDVAPGASGSRMLDVGCGIGRGLVFGTQLGLSMYGFDLSERAVEIARTWLTNVGVTDAAERVVAADIREMPWRDAFFDHAASDGVLDSMPFEIARAGVAEVARVIRPDGYFYCNLISGDETGRDPDFAEEEIVQGVHENNTTQSYFNRAKIDTLLGAHFEILSCALHQVVESGRHRGRWHITARRR